VDKIGSIEIKISGVKGNLDLSPDNYDIKEVIAILENAENLLYPVDKKGRPTISYRIEEGSVKHVFKTSIQYIIGFNALIAQLNQVQNIDFLEHITAKAFENIQETATARNYTFSIRTSIEGSNEMIIDNTTNFRIKESIWADAEFYFYGKLTNAGGKEKANIHIFTEELGILRIQTPISFLEKYNENLLYKSFGIRVSGKQNSETGEIDTGTLKFMDLVNYHPEYDEKYLKSLRDNAKKSWLKNINPDHWLNKIRGRHDS